MAENLLNFDAQQLTEWFAEMGEKPFRARQVLRWVHKSGEADFDAMSDLALSLRVKLKSTACIQAPKVMREENSADGTRKWLLDVGTGNAVENGVYSGNGQRYIVRFNSSGCALDCSFCSTGKQGFNRNLSTAEIIGQLWWANREVGRDCQR